MLRPLLDQDIRSLSEFRTNTATLIDQVRKTKRPLVLTQHGRSTAVVLDVSEYERLLEKLELLQDIQISQDQLSKGQGIDNETARKKTLERFKR